MPTADCIEVPGLLLEFSRVPWDEAACGFPVAQVSRLVLGEPEPESLCQAWSRFEAWRDAAQVRLVSCRIGAEHLREGFWLESVGFRFVEMVLQPSIDLATVPDATDPALEISRVGLDEIGPIAGIAAVAFVTDRFSIDQRLPRGASGKRYRRWVESVPHHATQRLYRAKVDGVVAGFFVSERMADGSCYWHLTAVDPAVQGRGYAKRIWRAMLSQARSEGAVRVTTTIAVRNIPVLNLYAGLGFRFGALSSTYHWVRS